jgi:Tfp pilus assembly protein PilE
MKTAVHLSQARGFTALELIIVLIIGFSIIGLSASKMKTMMVSSKSVKVLDAILNLSSAVESLQNSNGYGAADADLIPTLLTTEIIPKSIRAVNGVLTGEWDKAITVKASADGQSFIITYPNIPRAACNKLVKGLLENFTTVATTNGNIAANATLADIATGCANDANTLILTH